jgi:hypothetical protein
MDGAAEGSPYLFGAEGSQELATLTSRNQRCELSPGA